MNDSESTFEWMESPSVVIKPVDAIAVYSNAPGDIVIRQKSSKGIFREEDSVVVVVPRDRLDTVIAALQQEKARERARKPISSVSPINASTSIREA